MKNIKVRRYSAAMAREGASVLAAVERLVAARLTDVEALWVVATDRDRTALLSTLMLATITICYR